MGSSRGAGSDRLMRPSRDPAGWTADEMAATDAWLHVLTERERAEVHDAVEEVMARGLDFGAHHPARNGLRTLVGAADR